MTYQLEVDELGALSLKLFRKCQDSAHQEINSLGPRMRRLANTFEDLDDHLNSHPLSGPLQTELSGILNSCRGVLGRVQVVAKDYALLAPSNRAAWNSSNADLLLDIKSQLEKLLEDIQSFYDQLTKSNEGRVARALGRLVKDGDEKRLTRLRQSTFEGDGEAWNDVLNELEGHGVDHEAAAECRNFVVQWVRRADNAGRLPVVLETANPFDDRHASDFKLDVPSACVPKEQATKSQQSPATPSTQVVEPSENAIEVTQEHKTKMPEHPSGDTTVQPVLQQPASDELPPPVELLNNAPQNDGMDGQKLSSQENIPEVKKPELVIVPVASTKNYEEDSDDDLYGATPTDKLAQRLPQSSPTKLPNEPTSLTLIGLPEEEAYMTVTQSPAMSTRSTERHTRTASAAELRTATTSTRESKAASPVSLHAPTASTPISEQTHSRKGSLPTPKSPQSPGAFEKVPMSPGPPRPPKERITLKAPTAQPSQMSLSTLAEPTIKAQAPPSPAEVKSGDFNLEANAHEIVNAWQTCQWTKAHDLLGKQIHAVQDGAFCTIDGEPVQPSRRFIQFLQGVCLSMNGDFEMAKRTFDAVLYHVHTKQHIIDPIYTAACRWMGEACLMLSESLNAAMAWAVAFQSYQSRFGKDYRTYKMAHDLQQLNKATNALTILRVYATSNGKDLAQVFRSASKEWRLNIVLTSASNLYDLDSSYKMADHKAPQGVFTLDTTLLTRPCSIHNDVMPFQYDPLFCHSSAIAMVATLSRPKIPIQPGLIVSTRLGQSNSLFYKTSKDIDWLVDSIRECFSTFAIEYKVVHGTIFLVRLSQVYGRISYYNCYGLKLRRLAFRNFYGMKLTQSLYRSRSFDKVPKSSPLVHMATGTEKEQEDAVRTSLIETLKNFLTEKEEGRPTTSAGQLGVHMPELGDSSRVEMPDNAAMPPEMMASTQMPVELDSKKVSGWKRKKKASTTTVPPPGVFELPA